MVVNGRNPIDRWLGRIKPNTAKKYGEMFNSWMAWLDDDGGEFSGFSPDQLIQFQKDVRGDDEYIILEEAVYPYLDSKVDGRFTYKRQLLSVIRSFFKHNRAKLPSDENYEIRSEKPKVVGVLKLEEIRDVCIASKPNYRAIFLSMTFGGMGLEEFEYWNLNGFESTKRQIDQGENLIEIDLPGRKRNRNKLPYYTLIGGDALKAVRSYIDSHRPSLDEEGKPVNAIFVNQYGEPVSKNALYRYWMRHLRRLGIEAPKKKGGEKSYRTGRNPHEIRDVFRSQWSKSGVNPNIAEFMMGHTVDKNFYDKSYRDRDWVKRQYRKALDMLNFMSSDKPFGKVDLDKLEDQRREIERLKQEKDDAISELNKKIDMIEKRYETILSLLEKQQS